MPPKKRAVLTTLSPAEAAEAKAQSTLDKPERKRSADERSELSLSKVKELCRAHNSRYTIKLGGSKSNLLVRLRNAERRIKKSCRAGGVTKQKDGLTDGQKHAAAVLTDIEQRVRDAEASGKSEEEVDAILMAQYGKKAKPKGKAKAKEKSTELEDSIKKKPVNKTIEYAEKRAREKRRKKKVKLADVAGEQKEWAKAYDKIWGSKKKPK